MKRTPVSTKAPRRPRVWHQLQPPQGPNWDGKKHAKWDCLSINETFFYPFFSWFVIAFPQNVVLFLKVPVWESKKNKGTMMLKPVGLFGAPKFETFEVLGVQTWWIVPANLGCWVSLTFVFWWWCHSKGYVPTAMFASSKTNSNWIELLGHPNTKQNKTIKSIKVYITPPKKPDTTKKHPGRSALRLIAQLSENDDGLLWSTQSLVPLLGFSG